jgi:Tfp pilus assembly protein FimV
VAKVNVLRALGAKLVVALALASVALPFVPALARDDAQRPAASRTAYVVAPGDTLWGIARRVAPGRDPRIVVDELTRDNHLQGVLQPGEHLLVPATQR